MVFDQTQNVHIVLCINICCLKLHLCLNRTITTLESLSDYFSIRFDQVHLVLTHTVPSLFVVCHPEEIPVCWLLIGVLLNWWHYFVYQKSYLQIFLLVDVVCQNIKSLSQILNSSSHKFSNFLEIVTPLSSTCLFFILFGIFNVYLYQLLRC